MDTPRKFELHAMIDYCYWQLDTIKYSLGALKPKNNLEAMIDKATGYDKKVTTDAIKNARYLLICICRYKREYGADLSKDYEALQKIKELPLTL